MNLSLTDNIDCVYFSTWMRSQSSPEHRTNPSGNWNVPSAVPRNQPWSGCLIGRPTSSSAPSPTVLLAGLLVSSRCFSRFGINRSGWRTWVNGRNQAPLGLDGMFEGVVDEPNAASTQKEKVSQSPSPQPTQKWVSTRCWAVLLMVLLG